MGNTKLDYQDELLDNENKKRDVDDYEDGDDVSVAGIRPLPDDLLDAIDELNTERDRVFGLVTENIDLLPGIDADALILHAKKHGIGSLILLFKDAINQIGYSVASNMELVHRKSGVVIKL